MIERCPGVFLYTPPIGTPTPVVFDVPRSGREYPSGFRTDAPFADVHFMVSMHVEELWGLAPEAGCGLLQATFPNNWIDANRGLADLDPDLLAEPWPDPLAPTDKSARLGLGLIHSRTYTGHALQPRKLTVAEVNERIDTCWRPYHDRLEALIAAQREAAGVAFHLSCHCMGTIGPVTAHDHGQRRRDFCLSDRDGMTSSRGFIDAVAAALRSHGYSVSINDPFKGAESIRLHGNPAAGVHSVQIETIKELFFSEATFEKKPEFDRVRADMGKVAAEIAAYAHAQAGSQAG